MIAIGIIIIVLMFFMLSGLVSISNALNVAVKNQVEIIRLLKNSK